MGGMSGVRWRRKKGITVSSWKRKFSLDFKHFEELKRTLWFVLFWNGGGFWTTHFAYNFAAWLIENNVIQRYLEPFDMFVSVVLIYGFSFSLWCVLFFSVFVGMSPIRRMAVRRFVCEMKGCI